MQTFFFLKGKSVDANGECIINSLVQKIYQSQIMLCNLLDYSPRVVQEASYTKKKKTSPLADYSNIFYCHDVQVYKSCYLLLLLDQK